MALWEKVEEEVMNDSDALLGERVIASLLEATQEKPAKTHRVCRQDPRGARPYLEFSLYATSWRTTHMYTWRPSSAAARSLAVSSLMLANIWQFSAWSMTDCVRPCNTDAGSGTTGSRRSFALEAVDVDDTAALESLAYDVADVADAAPPGDDARAKVAIPTDIYIACI